ncbi:MAG: hypothetical protein IT458_16340 [Planctomycetes bacterium]|nr:hypothetical protein [Planctomycetota bacterium]
MRDVSTRIAFPRRTCAALLLALFAFGGVASPALAQDGDKDKKPAPSAPHESLEPIAADGFQKFMDLMLEFAKDQIAKLPSGDKSPRENAYGKLAAIQLAGAGSALALPAAGLALGGGIGLCVDACTVGADGGAGTLIGGGIGLGSGIVVGVGAFVTSLLATLPMVDEIERRYPPEGEAAGAGSRMVLGGLANRGSLAANAGPAESFYVNLVASLPDQFVTLIERWDRTPGLGAAEKNWLKSVEFARPQLQRLAWIKRNLKVSRNALPASDMFLDIGRILSGDHAAIERAWLAALGLNATGLELKNDKLTFDVPPPLRAVGLPAKLSAKVPDLNVKVGGNGGAFDPFLRLRMEAGPFDVDWGKVSIVDSGADKDLIQVEYSIKKGSRLGAAKITVKAGGNEDKVVDLRPELDRTLRGTLLFRLNGPVLEFRKARLNDLEFSLGVPKEIRDLPVVKDLLGDLGRKFEQEVREFLREHVPFAKLFDGFGRGAVQSLERDLQRDAARHGMASIAKVEKAEIKDGKIRVHVQGRELRRPKLSTTPEQAEQEWERFARPLAGKLPLRKVQPRPRLDTLGR